MTVIVGVLKETRPNERRVALVPAVADKLIKLGAEVQLEAGAGAAVKLADAAYKNVNIVADAKSVVSNADIVLAVQPPSLEIVQAMKSGAILISFVYVHNRLRRVHRHQYQRTWRPMIRLVPWFRDAHRNLRSSHPDDVQ